MKCSIERGLRFVAQKMSIGTMLKEAIPLAIFFATMSMALMLTSTSFEVFSIFRKSRLKPSSVTNDHGDMYLIRPVNNNEDTFEISSTSEMTSTDPKPLPSKSGLKTVSKSSSEVEIRNSLAAAKDFFAQGKFDKADKVYQHIIALNPKHPDVLTAYGQLLEEGYDDVVKAEHLYSKALIVQPAHEHAAERRRRTLPLVEEIDQRNFNRVTLKGKRLSQIPRHNLGLKRAKIEAYIQHIYHTNAMEGNTMSLMQTRAVVETGVAIGGKSIYEHNEILGMDAALQYINKTHLHQTQYINAQDILEIHKRVLGFVNLEEAGRFRQTQVFVGSHRPPPPEELQSQVTDFVEWLNSEREEEEDSLHPLELAALAHYKFVYIHPFYDGNGRVSRLIMNLILMQSGYPPVIINVEDKHEYYQTLQMANDGDVRPFIRFVADCTERTLDHYLAASESTSGMTVPGLVSRKERYSWTFTTEKSKGGRRKIVLSPPLPPHPQHSDSSSPSVEETLIFDDVNEETGGDDDDQEDDIIDGE